MKKRYRVAAAVVAAAALTVISGCTGCVSCAGCGGATTNLVPLNSNWYANTNYKKIQPTFTEGNTPFAAEEAVYTVKHDKSTARNTTYSVDYTGGQYKTLFKAVDFDKSAYAHADFAEGYPDKVTAYYYRTELTFKTVTFTVGEQTKELAGDEIITECYFLSVEDFLRPLYSHESIKSSTPAEMQTGTVDDAYVAVNRDIKTYYSYDGNTAKTVTADGGNESVKTVDAINSAANSCFDVASMDITVRANKISPSLNQQISVYSPAGGVQNYTLQGGTATFSDDENARLKSVLDRNGLYEEERDEDGNVKPLGATSVSVTYNGNLSGVSQTYVFASIKNASNNKSRATLLTLSAPLSYSLGTLNYTLEEIKSTLYHG